MGDAAAQVQGSKGSCWGMVEQMGETRVGHWAWERGPRGDWEGKQCGRRPQVWTQPRQGPPPPKKKVELE